MWADLRIPRHNLHRPEIFGNPEDVVPSSLALLNGRREASEDLFSALCSKTLETPESTKLETILDLSMYFSTPEAPEGISTREADLRPLLTLPPSSADCERAFSSVQHIYSRLPSNTKFSRADGRIPLRWQPTSELFNKTMATIPATTRLWKTSNPIRTLLRVKHDMWWGSRSDRCSAATDTT